MLYEVRDLKTGELRQLSLSSLSTGELEQIETFLPAEADVPAPSQDEHSDQFYAFGVEYVCLEIRLALRNIESRKIDWSTVKDRLTHINSNWQLCDAVAAFYGASEKFSSQIYEKIRAELRSKLTEIHDRLLAEVKESADIAWIGLSPRPLVRLEKDLILLASAHESCFGEFASRDLMNWLNTVSIRNVLSYGNGYFRAHDLRQVLDPGVASPRDIRA